MQDDGNQKIHIVVLFVNQRSSGYNLDYIRMMKIRHCKLLSNCKSERQWVQPGLLQYSVRMMKIKNCKFLSSCKSEE